MQFAANRLAIIGVGLIGGSVALALRKAGFSGEIVGCGRRVAELELAVQLGVIDRFETNPAVAVRDADCVLVCVPVLAMHAVFEAMRPGLSPEAVITDAGSTKQSVIAAAEDVWGELPPNFVPSHPIAGTEQSGVAAAFDSLYQNRLSILTPLESNTDHAIQTVEALWQSCGAHTTRMSPAHHDDVLAATSHLPHVLAYALVDTLAARPDSDEIFKYAAGGFRDFTRIASSNPEMWRDITTANGEALVHTLDALIIRLQGLRAAMVSDDRKTIYGCYKRAKLARDQYVDVVENAPVPKTYS